MDAHCNVVEALWGAVGSGNQWSAADPLSDAVHTDRPHPITNGRPSSDPNRASRRRPKRTQLAGRRSIHGVVSGFRTQLRPSVPIPRVPSGFRTEVGGAITMLRVVSFATDPRNHLTPASDLPSQHGPTLRLVRRACGASHARLSPIPPAPPFGLRQKWRPQQDPTLHAACNRQQAGDRSQPGFRRSPRRRHLGCAKNGAPSRTLRSTPPATASKLATEAGPAFADPPGAAILAAPKMAPPAGPYAPRRLQPPASWRPQAARPSPIPPAPPFWLRQKWRPQQDSNLRPSA